MAKVDELFYNVISRPPTKSATLNNPTPDNPTTAKPVVPDLKVAPTAPDSGGTMETMPTDSGKTPTKSGGTPVMGGGGSSEKSDTKVPFLKKNYKSILIGIGLLAGVYLLMKQKV